MRKRSLRARAVTVLLTASATMLLSACAPEPGAVQLARSFAGYSADYEPAASPKELAEQSRLVVQGELHGFIEGREHGQVPGDPGMARTVTMVVNVTAVLKGAGAGEGETVYVELPSPGNQHASAYRRPDEPFPVLLYLVPADNPDIIVNRDAGRPQGEVLYQPTTPQGLIAGTEESVVQILDFTAYSGASLEQFYPDVTTYPEPDNVPEGS